MVQCHIINTLCFVQSSIFCFFLLYAELWLNTKTDLNELVATENFTTVLKPYNSASYETKEQEFQKQVTEQCMNFTLQFRSIYITQTCCSNGRLRFNLQINDRVLCFGRISTNFGLLFKNGRISHANKTTKDCNQFLNGYT